MLPIKSIVKIKMFDDASLDNILPPDETNLPFNIPFNIPFLNNQLKSDLFSDSIDLAHEKNEEDDFNTDYNQSFPYFFEDKQTNFETKKKDNLTSPKNNNSDIKDLKIYTFEDISKILKENSLNNILDQFTKDELIEKYESNMKLLNQKRKRNRTKNKENKNENEEQKKIGRKKKGDDSERKHGKYSPDNIIKKIKSRLFDKIINFVNRIVNKTNENSKKEIFKKLDYKYTNQMKKELDLELLNSPLKDILMKDISPKYTNLDPKSNRVNLEKIQENEKNDEIIMFVLNLPFREFIELFCLKKTLKDIDGSKTIDNNILQRLMNNFPRIYSLLSDISRKNDKVYLSHFVFHLYNYEQWFYTKLGRSSRKKNKRSKNSK
jgi:hypothetical protein